MKKNLDNEKSFLTYVEKTLELTPGILSNNLDEHLEDIEEWDSLAIMSFITLLDSDYQIEIEIDALEDCKNPKDLFKLTNKLSK